MTNSIDRINELVAVLREGENFYRDSASKVQQDRLRTMFTNIADERHRAALELEPFVREAGEDVSKGDFFEVARKFYSDVVGYIADDNDTMIAQLEEHEDRTLEMLDDAIEKSLGTEAEHVLRKNRAIFQITHDRMKALKEAA